MEIVELRLTYYRQINIVVLSLIGLEINPTAIYSSLL